MKRYIVNYDAKRQKYRMYTNTQMLDLTKIMVITEDLGLGFCKTLMPPGYKPQGSILGLTGGLWRTIADTLKCLILKVK